MIILEVIWSFLFDFLVVKVLSGPIYRLNNAVLRLRGKETESPEVLKLQKLKKKYELKTVSLLKAEATYKKGSTGVILELIDNNTAAVEMNSNQEIIEVELKRLLKSM